MSDPYADIDRLLDELNGPGVPERVRELAAALADRLLTVHRDALVRLMADVGTDVADDPDVAPVLLLHGLHPLPADERVRRAVAEAVRATAPALGAAVEVGPDGATVTLDLSPTDAPEVRRAIEQAVLGAAPECPAVRVITPVAVELGRRIPPP